MPHSDISREPTAHVNENVVLDLPDVTSEVARAETAHVSADVSVYGPGDAP